VAACHIHGLTLHSWAGIGVDAPLERAVQLAMRPSFASAWRRCTHLGASPVRSALIGRRAVIDECSMMDADYFTSLEAVARAVRGSRQPFGGIQLVLCGDFLQLPPVTVGDRPRKYCFQVRSVVSFSNGRCFRRVPPGRAPSTSRPFFVRCIVKLTGSSSRFSTRCVSDGEAP